ncbi:hypothetical protein [Paracoccus denitrificans]|uniref:hypothetical protein n=1 Tax=Paracoccus denitrificans TaxID=266 RepID=UPI003364F7ED
MKAETACKRSSPPNHQDCSRSDPTMQIRVSLFSNLRQQMAILPLTLCAAAGAPLEPAAAQPRPQIAKCIPGQTRATDEYCLVDGDTIWIDGEKLRMEGYDTPLQQ